MITKEAIKNHCFRILHKLLSPFWKRFIERNIPDAQLEQLASMVSVLIMHKDVGNNSRNQNYDDLKKFVLSAKFRLIDCEAEYFSSIESGISHIKDRFNLRVVQKSIISPSGSLIEFPYAPGALGIYATLLKALRNFEESEEQYLIVFEDDLRNGDEFNKVLNYVLSYAPRDWEVLNLIADPEAQKPLKQVLLEAFKPLTKNYSTSISACYVLNRDSAKRIYEDLTLNGIRTNLDWYLFNGSFLKIANQPKFNTLQVNPFFPVFCSLISDYRRSTILTE